MQDSPLLADDTTADLAQSAAAAAAPLISGQSMYLWTGAVAVLVVAVLLFVLLGRWRSGSRRRETATPTDFFQPAGENADITFDDAREVDVTMSADGLYEFTDGAQSGKKRKFAPFAGMFGKKDETDRIEPEQFEPERNDAPIIDSRTTHDDIAVESDPALASVKIDRDAPHRAEPAVDWNAIEREARLRAEEEADRVRREEERRQDLARVEAEERRRDEEASRRRRLAEREAEDHRRLEAEAARNLYDRPSHDRPPYDYAAHDPQRFAETSAGQDDLSRTLSEVEEALHAQREAIQAETRSLLDSFARRFSDRLDALAHNFDNGASKVADAGGATAQDGRLLDEIARRLDAHRSDVSAAIDAIGKRLERLSSQAGDAAALRAEIADLKQAMAPAAAPSAPTLQLADIVRNALPPAGYEFDAPLSNSRRADCLIRLARPPGPIAIDAQFPVEAFHALHERRSDAAASEFRRAALRHIVNVAERLISPGFTADSAMIFLPAEDMVSELHTRFPDVIQDSYRARVFIVSPTTLMATLHTLGAFLKDAPRRDDRTDLEALTRRALDEVGRVNERVEALEARAAQRLRESDDLKSANDAPAKKPVREEDRAERPRPTIRAVPDFSSGEGGDLYIDEDAPESRSPAAQTRPPFPLR